MSNVFSKFKELFHIDDDFDDDFDDDYLDDDYLDDDYEESSQKKSNKLKFDKKKVNDYKDDFEKSDSSYKNTYNKSSSKITPIKQSSSYGKSSGMGVCVIKPTSIDDGREICETLLDNRTVILNLEGLQLDIAQRIIDFTSGATFAMKGNLQKISNFIFLVTPENVDISGDLQDLLGNSFDVSSVRTRF